MFLIRPKIISRFKLSSCHFWQTFWSITSLRTHPTEIFSNSSQNCFLMTAGCSRSVSPSLPSASFCLHLTSGWSQPGIPDFDHQYFGHFINSSLQGQAICRWLRTSAVTWRKIRSISQFYPESTLFSTWRTESQRCWRRQSLQDLSGEYFRYFVLLLLRTFATLQKTIHIILMSKVDR